MSGALSILINDITWTTTLATDSSTVQELISLLNAEHHLGSCSSLLMTLCHHNSAGLPEQILLPQECPMTLMIPGDRHNPSSSFLRLVTPSLLTSGKQKIEFCGFADIKVHRKDIWATRWIALKERFLTWSKTPFDKKIRGQLDLNDAYLHVDSSNNTDCVSKKTTTPFMLKVVKPDRTIQIRFENAALLHGWLHALNHNRSHDTDNLHFDFINNDVEQHEFKAWSKREERFQKFSKISAVLNCPTAFNIFFSYLKLAHSEEGLLFWRAVKKFKSKQVSDKHAAEIAEAIFHQFIAQGSHFELPLSCYDRSVIVSSLKAKPVDRNVFDQLADLVIMHLDQEKFSDFKKSPHFRSILIELSKSPNLLDLEPSALCWDNEQYEDG